MLLQRLDIFYCKGVLLQRLDIFYCKGVLLQGFAARWGGRRQRFDLRLGQGGNKVNANAKTNRLQLAYSLWVVGRILGVSVNWFECECEVVGSILGESSWGVFVESIRVERICW